MSESLAGNNGGEFQLSMPRRRELLLRFSRLCIANDMFQAYSTACGRDLEHSAHFNPERLPHLLAAQYAELPLFPMAELSTSDHASGYMFRLARFDPDDLQPIPHTDVPVATYTIEYGGKPVESLGIIWTQFTHDQANMVKEYALALTPENK